MQKPTTAVMSDRVHSLEDLGGICMHFLSDTAYQCSMAVCIVRSKNSDIVRS